MRFHNNGNAVRPVLKRLRSEAPAHVQGLTEAAAGSGTVNFCQTCGCAASAHRNVARSCSSASSSSSFSAAASAATKCTTFVEPLCCPTAALAGTLLVERAILPYLSARMRSIARLASQSLCAAVGETYDGGPLRRDDVAARGEDKRKGRAPLVKPFGFTIFRFNASILIIALESQSTFAREHLHLYIRLPKKHRLIGEDIVLVGHGTYQTAGDPASYGARVYGTVVKEEFVESQKRRHPIIPF